jgi:hypothetical protein
MISFAEAIQKLESNSKYSEWKKENPKSYLTYCFFMASPDIKEEWQLGCYNPDRDTITAFSVGDEIIINPESEIFKDDTNVLELAPEKVKIGLDEARAIVKKIQQEKYSAHKSVREMIILQSLKIGQVWNITIITNTYRTLNVKIDSATGAVLKDELIELFQVDK